MTEKRLVARSFYDFVHDTTFVDLPADVVDFGKRCIIDLIGVAVGGSATELSKIIRNHVAEQFAPGNNSARMIFDGRRVSPVGAALAGGMTIDALDAHDGHKLTKGHVGCGVLPAALACLDAGGIDDGGEFLTAVVIGYEIGTRAGIALHRTAYDYHTSGAWISIACAAIGARALGLDAGKTREAIGIAEYHGPRSQMMRCIDHPTMVKDGSGWGAMAGISGAFLAKDGFTGAPALTVESSDVADLWDDLGGNWRIFEQYFKPHPVCRWAQPAVEAVLELRRAHQTRAEAIDHIEVVTFHEASRLATTRPGNTEEAQYSLPFPTAAAAVRGKVGPDEVADSALSDPAILRLSESMKVTELEKYNKEFPAHRFAHVKFMMKDGRVLISEPTEPRGDPEIQLSNIEISAKFQAIAGRSLGQERAARIEQHVSSLGSGTGLCELLSDITPSIGRYRDITG